MKRAATSPPARIILALVTVVCLTAFASGQERAFTTIDVGCDANTPAEFCPAGISPGGTAPQTKPFGISPRGQIVGLYVGSDNVTRGFLLDRSDYTAIFHPGSIRTNALGINASGQIVGRYDDINSHQVTIAHGYLYSDGVFQTIDEPDAAGFTVVTDINPSGDMVGRYQSANGTFHGFSLVGGAYGVFTTVDHLDADGNPDMGPMGIQGMAINAEGIIAGFYQDRNLVFHAFLLDHGVFTTIDPPNAIKTGGSGGVLHLDPAGEVVASYITAADKPLPCGCQGHGFTYRRGTFTTFDYPGAVADGTINTGINPQGDIVGIYVDRSNVLHGFLAPKGTEKD